MAHELTMPKLSDSMEEATILRWLKSPGETFVAGEPMVEIETDKATVVYEAETDGVLASILVPEGTAAKLGEPIATLNGGDTRPAPVSDERAARPSASPVARRKASELGISLSGLSGSGPGGRITVKDVERAAAAAPAVGPAPSDLDKGAVESVPLSPTRATIAKRMAQSGATVPAFQVAAEVDMSAIVELRRAGELVDPLPSINDFVVRATALTLREFSAFNSSFLDGRIERYSRINVGVAVAIDDVLLVPTLFDADRMPLAQIAAQSRVLADRARRRSLQPAELTQSTFTVSNLGMYGAVHSFTALVDPPQAGILAVGSVRRRPSEQAGGGVAFRETMIATLSADHRVVYGADGARFVAHVKNLLEHPLCLLI